MSSLGVSDKECPLASRTRVRGRQEPAVLAELKFLCRSTSAEGLLQLQDRGESRDVREGWYKWRKVGEGTGNGTERRGGKGVV